MAHQPIPDIPNIKAHWERRTDPLPFLMVPMSDGNVIRYNAEVKQPRPVLKDGLDRFTKVCVGYEMTGDAATSTGRRK
jgi:hypothetical protein